MNGISILIATRERPHRLQTFIHSLLSTVLDKSKIEVLLYIDDTDPTIAEYDALINKTTEIAIKRYVQPFTPNGPQRWNYLGQFAQYEIIGMSGDDSVFCTKDWDQEVYEIHNRYQDHICLPYFTEAVTDREYIAFHPLPHRRHLELLGYLLPPQFTIYCSDDWLSKLYNFVGRAFQLKARIEHQHPVWGFHVDDEIYHHKHYPMNTNQMMIRDLQVWQLTQDQLMADVQKFLREMKQESKWPQLQMLQNNLCKPAGRCICKKCIAKDDKSFA